MSLKDVWIHTYISSDASKCILQVLTPQSKPLIKDLVKSLMSFCPARVIKIFLSYPLT